MADEKPKMVKVEAIKYHTNAGAEYQVGDTYEVDEAAVDSLAANGFALRADRAAVAKAAKADADKAAAPAKRGKTAVAPMTTATRTGKALARTPRMARATRRK